MYQCNFTTKEGANRIKFGVTKIYADAQPHNAVEGEYANFSKRLFIKKTKPKMYLTKKVSTSALYEKTPEDLIIALAFDIPNQQYLSVV